MSKNYLHPVRPAVAAVAAVVAVVAAAAVGRQMTSYSARHQDSSNNTTNSLLRMTTLAEQWTPWILITIRIHYVLNIDTALKHMAVWLQLRHNNSPIYHYQFTLGQPMWLLSYRLVCIPVLLSVSRIHQVQMVLSTFLLHQICGSVGNCNGRQRYKPVPRVVILCSCDDRKIMVPCTTVTLRISTKRQENHVQFPRINDNLTDGMWDGARVQYAFMLHMSYTTRNRHLCDLKNVSVMMKRLGGLGLHHHHHHQQQQQHQVQTLGHRPVQNAHNRPACFDSTNT